MTRLKYTPPGFLRSLQMSRHRLAAFVEGQDIDSYFYGGICERSCSRFDISYQIRLAQELPYQSGGKATLIRFYRYLSRAKKLVSLLGGKNTAVIFFLDKDIDDILRIKCRSRHVIYTEFYDVHNHIFLYSGLTRAVASAISRDLQEVKRQPLFRNDWCTSASQRWRNWVVFCVLSRTHKVRNANYGVTSRINSPINGAVDNGMHQAQLQQLRSLMGWTQARFRAELERVRKVVDRCFSHGKQDYLFKGKWYSTILERDLCDAYRGRGLHSAGIGRRICSALAATLDFSDTWADSFASDVEIVIQSV